ncbi:hypothetical protein HPB51_017935 [Rhipicephalus microplus]|uniref:Ump-cmp kinase family n=1 Tax=Rhipicephalus microplus TaxID=6941 RepID=A0A9J6EPT6_RHIMP|nr:hypothetical protein HPB51_017935 [Rhipicephalus microplus]
MLVPIATRGIRVLHCSIERFLPARGLLTRAIGDCKAWFVCCLIHSHGIAVPVAASFLFPAFGPAYLANVSPIRRVKRPVFSLADQIGLTGPLKRMSGAKPNVVFVLGPPGSGKGTQCQKLVEVCTCALKCLCVLRWLCIAVRTPGSQFGEVIDHHIRNGTIVPVEITCRLLDRAMQSSGKSHFLIDGFPRNKDNLDGWNREMSDRVNLQFILFLECPEEVFKTVAEHFEPYESTK